MEFLPFVSLTHPVYTLTAQEIRVPRPLVNPSSFLLLPCLVPEEVQVAIPRSPVYGARSHMDPQCRGGVLGWGGNRLQFRMRRRLPRKWSARLCKDWHRSWELKPPPLNVGTGAAFDILNLRQKENIEEGECAGKKKKSRCNLERPCVWKPSRNMIKCLLCAGPCAQTYEETGMNKTETLCTGRMEDWLYILISVISQTHQERQEHRAGDPREKVSLFFVSSLMKMSVERGFARLSIPSGGNLRARPRGSRTVRSVCGELLVQADFGAGWVCVRAHAYRKAR